MTATTRDLCLYTLISTCVHASSGGIDKSTHTHTHTTLRTCTLPSGMHTHELHTTPVQTFNQTLRTSSGNAGGANIFFHIHGKGNKNAEGLFYGQAVKYSQGVSAKGVCAENIVAITGVRTRPCFRNV